MEYLQHLVEVILARLQTKFYNDELLGKYESLFSTEFLEVGEMEDAYQNLIEEDSIEAIRYRELVKLCGDTQAGRMLLECCLVGLFHPQFLEFTMEQWNGLTLDGMAWLCEEEVDYKELKHTYERAKWILRCQKNPRLFLLDRFGADARILDYFLDSKAIDERLVQVGTVLYQGEEELGDTYINSEVQRQLERFLKQEKQGCVQIAGNAGCGKRFLLKKACSETGEKMLMVDITRIKTRENQKNAEESFSYPNLFIREALLHNCSICLYHISEDSLEQVLDYFLMPMLEQKIRVFLCTDADTEVIPRLDEPVEKVEIPPYGINERIALWQGFSKAYHVCEQIDCITAGSKFKLSAGEIRKAVERIARSATNTSIGETEISRICEDVLLKPACGSIKRISVQYTLDDLKLWPEQKRILNNICAHVWYRHKVYDEWNLDSRYAYGKNVSALFYGPPGTGKTMAVHVIANMLNLPLYRVDLSQVVDKYIGETEKRLEEIFNAAEKNNTVLFFDEADAIFGKRSDVNEAKDKYANTEVSYILQRIEQYDGIVILATNYRKNIDEAFMRRIRYVVEFTLPDEVLRKELWKSSFSKETPIEDLDYDYLAEQFELSGGAIKNIVLNATFLAAAEDRAVGMIDVLQSVRSENVKVGKVMLNEDFGLYAELMKEADEYLFAKNCSLVGKNE